MCDLMPFMRVDMTPHQRDRIRHGVTGKANIASWAEVYQMLFP